MQGEIMNVRIAKGVLGLLPMLALTLLMIAVWSVPASARELVLGMQCDRSGPTQTVGTYLCAGAHDYIKLMNKNNSLGKGNSMRLFEIDHGYKVDRGLEGYERHKAAGAISYYIYGTPQTYALTPKLTADKIPGTSPGFGSAAAANGKAYPYIFPVAATYWSQAGTGVKYVLDQWKGSGKPKIAYLYYDNPAGREPLPIMRDLAKRIGFEYKEYAVPAPGVEMRPQVLDIARKFKADFVLAHLFGRAPTVSIKELKRVGFPLDKVISFVWGGGESNIDAAGWKTSEGYKAMHFAGVGPDHQVLRDIIKMYKDEGKPPPKEMKISVYYNRGVLISALHARAIELAVKKHGIDNVTGEDVKNGFEAIRDFTLGGFLPPLNITTEDHEGGGWVKIYQVQGGKFVPITDWIQGYRDVVMEHVRKAG